MAEKGVSDGLLGWLLGGLAVGLAVLALMVGAYAFGFERGQDDARESAPPATTVPPETPPPTETAPPATPPPPETVPAADGAEVFAAAGCGGCHTLAAAGASGAVGPSLDNPSLTVELVSDLVANGRGGMPAFSGQLDETEIQAVAEYVVDSAGG